MTFSRTSDWFFFFCSKKQMAIKNRWMEKFNLSMYPFEWTIYCIKSLKNWLVFNEMKFTLWSWRINLLLNSVQKAFRTSTVLTLTIWEISSIILLSICLQLYRCVLALQKLWIESITITWDNWKYLWIKDLNVLGGWLSMSCTHAMSLLLCHLLRAFNSSWTVCHHFISELWTTLI